MDYIMSYSQLVTQPNFPSKSLVLEVLVPDVVVSEVLVVLLLDVDVLVWVELEDDELVVLVSLSVVVVVRHSETGTWFTRIPPLTRHKALTSDWDQATRVVTLPLGTYEQDGSSAWPKRAHARYKVYLMTSSHLRTKS